jgi:hypothetical protein
MNSRIFTDNEGVSWAVDFDGAHHLLRSYVRATSVLHRARFVYKTEALGPLGTFKITLTTVEVDYTTLGSQVNRDSNALYTKFHEQLQHSGRRAFHTLLGFRSATVDKNEDFRKMQMDASRQTNDSISSVSSSAQRWMDGAKVVRDLSATVVMVGASFLSGGAAAAALSGGSVLKGSFTFQDKKMEGKSNSEAASAGTFEASTDLFIGVIGMGEGGAMKEVSTVAGKAKAAGIILFGSTFDGATEFVKAHMDGKTVRQAAMAGGARFGFHAVTAGLAGPKLDKYFDDPQLELFSFPVLVTRATSAKLATETTVSSVEDWVVKKTGGETKQEQSVPQPAKTPNHDRHEWHTSIACTYLPQGDSDLVYVEQNVMKRIGPSRRSSH